MKDENDALTIDAYAGIARSVGHYAAVAPFSRGLVSGRRWMGSTTPDDVKDFWQTPRWLFAYFERMVGGFDIDAAASEHNALCPEYFTQEQDALSFDWPERKSYWLNCPYSSPAEWVAKAITESRQRRSSIVMLLPGDTSTRWFAEALEEAAELYILISDGKKSGRVSFINALTGKEGQGNNKGSIVFVFRPHTAKLKVEFITRTECQNSLGIF